METPMASLTRRSLAEALGTFALVFIGAGSAMSKFFPGADFGLLGIAIAHGLVLSVLVTATMGISGGHLNPAVTLGLLAVRRVTPIVAVAHIVAQLLGAVIAAAALKGFYPGAVQRASGLGVPHLANSISLGQGILIELILTFLLVSAVFGTCVNSGAHRIGGFGIGLTVLFGILVGGPLTGAALNPARAFGPALVSGQWVAHVVYWIGPIVGGVLAALLWEYVLIDEADRVKKQR
jgi:MIP family channel proteins